MVIAQKESLLRFGREQDLKGGEKEIDLLVHVHCITSHFSLIFLSFLFSFLSYLFSLPFTLFFFLLPESSVFRSFLQGTARAFL